MKNNETINVLSVDWDYFIDVTDKERHMLFPDGGNEELSDTLKSIIWLQLYASNQRMANIGILKNPLQMVRDAIESNTDGETRVMIADSHKHIYEFINDNKKTGAAVNLVNIDFHHDAYSKLKTVNCGNWLTHAMNKFPKGSHFTWIARSDSSKNGFKGNGEQIDIVKDDFIALKDVKWDLVFICRSSVWSPPHLDKEFIETFEWLKEEHYLFFETNIFTSRYDNTFIKGVEDLREMMSNVFAMNNVLRTT